MMDSHGLWCQACYYEENFKASFNHLTLTIDHKLLIWCNIYELENIHSQEENALYADELIAQACAISLCVIMHALLSLHHGDVPLSCDHW